MNLIELFLPLYDSQKQPFRRQAFEEVERELIAKFKGFTAYPRSPASGIWKNPSAEVEHDQMVIYEVMADGLDTEWWKNYRRSLEERFKQDKILIRSHPTEVL